MRWNKQRAAFVLASIAAISAMIFAFRAMPAHAAPRSIFIYAHPGAGYPVDVFEVDGKQYVDLAAVLFGLGRVSARIDGRDFRLRLDKTEIRFQAGDPQARIGRATVQLSDPFVLQEGRGLVPVASLPALLSQILQERVDFHELSRRLFIGNSSTRLALALKKPQTLTLSFTAPVSPQIASEGGSLRLLFSHDGVTSTAAVWKFEDPLIAGARFSETDAGPEIIITGSEPLLASFADGSRTITIAAAPRAASAPVPPPASPSSAPPPAAAASQPSPATPAATATALPSPGATPPEAPVPLEQPIVHSRLLIVLDAAHGGDERGAALSDKLPEKDVTLAIARRLRGELQNRGIPTLMVRDGDSALSLDQRAVIANSARGALYLAIHAGALGRGLRLYTSTLAASAPQPGGFLPWETAQSSYVLGSRKIAGALMDDLEKRSLDFPVELLPAPVRPLNNVCGAALAVEVAPQDGDPASLANGNYQQAVAAALAGAIASAHPEAAE